MKKIVYVDMDEVLCNFIKRYQEMLAEEPGILWPQSQYGFFANLEPIPNGVESVKELCKYYDVYILTAPSYMNPLCYTEKRVWIEKYFGLEFCRKLIICDHKHLLKGDYLIDDNQHKGFEGKWIAFGRTEFPTWKEVMDFLLIEHLTVEEHGF